MGLIIGKRSLHIRSVETQIFFPSQKRKKGKRVIERKRKKERKKKSKRINLYTCANPGILVSSVKD